MTLPIFLLLSLFSRPATAASTRQGTPPPMVAVVRIADQDNTPAAEYVGHEEAMQAVDLHARAECFPAKTNFGDGD